MGHHFSGLGIELVHPEDFQNLALRAAESATHHDVPGGRYLQWRGDSGAELWLQFSDAGQFLDIQPHFVGSTVLRFGAEQRLSRPTDTALDGAWLGWVDPASEDPSQGRYQLLIEAPDFLRHHDLALPALVGMQVAAFAKSAQWWTDPDEFFASGSSASAHGLMSVVPAGEITRIGGETEPRRAQALITGVILRSTRRSNELTGGGFVNFLIESDGGRFDVLLDERAVGEEPPAGGILSALCWISGRVE